MACVRSKTEPDLAALAAAHPEVASELPELWATVQVTEDLAGSSMQALGLSDAVLDGEGRRKKVVSSALARELPRQFGEYELVAELGRGGMGVVFQGYQKRLSRSVALKMILRGEFASAQEIDRFRAEAEFTAQLNHPNIVKVFEVGEQDGQPFFSMQYVDGTTLARRLQDGPLTARDAARLLLPVCQAMAAAHERGLVHRDLKPSNILIDQNGTPLITDFGLAKLIASNSSATGTNSAAMLQPQQLTQTGDRIGTPNYMSPEQVAGYLGQVTAASDVYSLGAILYQCLTGRPPFQAASDVDTLFMVLEQEPPAITLFSPRVDPDLEMITLKCLQKPPELRYPNAAALAADLAAFLANEPVSARSTNIMQLISRAMRETHHAVILENWGLLWMWHSMVLLILCVITNVFQAVHLTARTPYFGLWVVGLGTWAIIFWKVRHRSGPITFVERQIAHVWAASMIASSLLFGVETLLGMPVCTLSPVLPLTAAMVFLVKAGMLSGTFYFQSLALFATAIAMAGIRHLGWPDFGLSLYGVVISACFFVPGLKYYLQRRRGMTSNGPRN